MRVYRLAVDCLNLKKAGWSLGWVSALDLEGRTIWIVDAHGYGKRFVAHADEKLTAFLELGPEIRSAGRLKSCGGSEIKLDKLSRNH